MLRPPRLLGGKSPKPRFLSRKQQANLGLQVVAFFILVALVLVAVVLIPHGGRALMGSGGSSSGSAPVLEKRTAPAPVSPKGAAAPGGSSTTAMPAAVSRMDAWMHGWIKGLFGWFGRWVWWVD